jgi:predicted DNA-binding transcriptional regulator AlpA
MTTTAARKPRRNGSRPLATTQQVADYLGISVGALRQRRYLGDAPKAARVGTELRWRWEDVDAWLDKRAA